MTKVSLRAYNHQIESLIEQGQRLDEAIAHCRHILKTYSKQLEAYRLLGKACLEAKRFDEAVDIFQRVLMAAPEDFVAHVGMSIISDEQNRLADAIWHMERAFEVQPSNAAIQGELQRLMGRRDGVEPPKIRLTRGALAHMYVQGNLFPQAISEMRAVLSNDPQRSDMQTLLAKAYFRNGQKTEASDICSELLRRYPYCLDANRLMVEILAGTQNSAVQEYRQRVNELDPYAAFATGSVFDSDKVPDSAVIIERLDYADPSTERSVVPGSALGSRSTPSGIKADQPSSQLGAARTEGGALEAGQEAAPVSPHNDDLPAFLRRGRWSNSAAATEGPTASSPESETESGAVQGDLPDWVKALAPADEDELITHPAATTPENLSEKAGTPEWLRSLGGGQAPRSASSTEGAAPEDALDWFRSLGGSVQDEPAPQSIPSSAADWLTSLRADQPSTPEVSAGAGEPQEPSIEPSGEWLTDYDTDVAKPEQAADAVPAEPNRPPSTPQLPTNLASLGTTAQEQDEALAWLEGLAAKHGARSEEFLTDPSARTDVAPEWVKRAQEIGEHPAQPAGRRADTGDDLTDVWLRNLRPEESEIPTPGQGVPETEGLGSSPAESKGTAGIEAGVAKEEAPIIDEAETAGLLNDLGPNGTPQPPVENAPDWLHANSPGPVQPGTHLPLVPASAFESTVDLPDWLAGLEKADPAAPPSAAASDDLPAWLQAQAESEPQATEPTRAADWQPVQAAATTKPVEEVPQVRQESDASVPLANTDAQTVAPALPRDESATPPPIVAAKAPASPAAALPKPSSPVPIKVSAGAGRALADAASLGGAQAELKRGNIAAALEIYSRLIRKGKSLQEIIRDLRDALYRYPVEVPILQALGDAYMRSNRLQEALDAYTKAEELLR